ncbi:MAG: glycosyltransferase family 9 protein [Ignavibacteria bacterium]|nr:glycosyltransferase family 9 protein [Ignavibacteria bacterium]
MNSILVIRLSSLGDVILSTCLVRQLRRTYPGVVIDVAVNDKFAGVWDNNPHIRNVWPITFTNSSADVDNVKLKMLESLNEQRYDLVVDLQNNIRSKMLRRGLGVALACLDKHRLEKLALVHLKMKPDVVMPIVERYRKTVEHLPLAFDTDGPELWLKEEHDQGYYPESAASGKAPYQKQFNGDNGNSGVDGGILIGIAAGAKHFTKRWPVVKWAELCAEIIANGNTPVLLGGLDDVALNDEIVAGVGGVDGTVSRADGATTIQETIRAIDKCAVVVSNDSAVMHMATARRVPVVAIFGSSVVELGFAPFGSASTIIQHDVACRPCSHIGRASCPKKHFLCMNGIEVAEVIHGVQKLLG